MTGKAKEPARILVVDDERAVRELVTLHLANEGYEVSAAEDAVVGGRLLLEKKFDLLVIDAQLPYWSGIEFAATLIADRDIACPPIIFITGRQELAGRAGAIANACLVKPFLSTDLLAAVSEALHAGQSYAGVRTHRVARRSA